MTKNPFLNALAALAYIAVVASLMFYGPGANHPDPHTILMPMAVLSLFVLSAAVMGYLFLSQPIQLYFVDDNKPGAVKLFLQTVGVFAIITFLILTVLTVLF